MIDFDKLLKILVDEGASELFITCGMPPRMKVHGELIPISRTALTVESVEELINAAMDFGQVNGFEREEECNFLVQSPLAGGFHVSAFFQKGNPGMMLRRISH